MPRILPGEIELSEPADDNRGMNRYFKMLLKNAFLRDSAQAPELARYLLLRLQLPSDAALTEFYHRALSDTCFAAIDLIRAEQDRAEAIQAKLDLLEFLAERRPYSPRKSCNRPEHYWAALKAWASAAEQALEVLPRGLQPAGLVRDVRFYKGWTCCYVAYPGWNWRVDKLENSALWKISRAGETVTFTWGRLLCDWVRVYASPTKVLLVHEARDGRPYRAALVSKSGSSGRLEAVVHTDAATIRDLTQDIAVESRQTEPEVMEPQAPPQPAWIEKPVGGVYG
jgi:hypothetical protein